jgi:hypothetical protein
VPIPALRKIAREFAHLPQADIRRLMQSTVHEERSLANEVLCRQFRKAPEADQKKIFDFYMRNRRYIRDWDAVEGSAPYIVGPWLLERDKALLYELAQSLCLWGSSHRNCLDLVVYPYGPCGRHIRPHRNPPI